MVQVSLILCLLILWPLIYFHFAVNKDLYKPWSCHPVTFHYHFLLFLDTSQCSDEVYKAMRDLAHCCSHLPIPPSPSLFLLPASYSSSMLQAYWIPPVKGHDLSFPRPPHYQELCPTLFILQCLAYISLPWDVWAKLALRGVSTTPSFLLSIKETARRSNQSILKEISPDYSLEGLMLKLKLHYFGHLMWRTNSLEKTVMLGKIEGGRRRGRQRMRWLDGITDAMDVSLSRFQE